MTDWAMPVTAADPVATRRLLQETVPPEEWAAWQALTRTYQPSDLLRAANSGISVADIERMARHGFSLRARLTSEAATPA